MNAIEPIRNFAVDIRQAQLEDHRAIAHVQLASWYMMFADSNIEAEAYLAQFSDDERSEAWRELLSSASPPVVYVAQTNDQRVIGFASSMLTQAGTPYASELLSIHILPGYRRQGIGRQLIAVSARHMQALGCESLWLWTLADNPARAVYDRLGGVLVDEKTYPINKNDVEIKLTEVAYGWAAIKALF
jgi:ribosomal protein S18 acetylase RimI-like enzyme